MTEKELRDWADARKDSSDAVALAVGRLFAKLDEAGIDLTGFEAEIAEHAMMKEIKAQKALIELYESQVLDRAQEAPVKPVYGLNWPMPVVMVPKEEYEKMKFADISANEHPVGVLGGVHFNPPVSMEEALKALHDRPVFDGSTGTPEHGKAGRIDGEPPGAMQ